MKKLYIVLAGLLCFCAAHAQGVKTGWKELDAFHDMVPKYLHTAVAGHTQPIKESSGKLLDAAKKWQSAKAPKGSNTAKYKSDLAELVKECTDLDAAVKAHQPDAAISALADKTHKTFHMILAETVIEH